MKVLLASGEVTGLLGGGIHFKIHPDLMTRTFTDGTDDYTKSVRRDFKTTMAAGNLSLRQANEDRTILLEKSKKALDKFKEKQKNSKDDQLSGYGGFFYFDGQVYFRRDCAY